MDKFTETIYIKLNNIDDYVNFNINVYESNDYAFNQLLLSKLFGIAYGIIFAAFLYYIALYIFNREKTYIYYKNARKKSWDIGKVSKEKNISLI